MVSAKELAARLKNARDVMACEGIKNLFVTSEANVKYLSGVDTGRILIGRRGAVLWVKELYYEIYRSLYRSRGYPLDVRVFKKGVIEENVRRRKIKLLYVDDMPQSKFMLTRKALKARCKTTSLLKSVREVKSRYEINCIRRAGIQAVAGMKKAEHLVKVGVPELDVVGKVEAEIRMGGSGVSPFGGGMLLASGSHSATVHAQPRLNPIVRGPVIVDLGGNCEGYFSDMTRTLSAGKLKPGEKKILDFVENLELDVVDMIYPGMMIGEVHEYIEKAFGSRGYEMVHASGHGVGLEIHEDPYVGPGNKKVFEKNMVFTIEPGVYLPRKFGIRFEDTVVLKNKCKMLTR